MHESRLSEQARYVKFVTRFVREAVLIESVSPPIALHPSQHLLPIVRTARNALLAACEARGVEILWRLYAPMEREDIAFSRDYWEYAKELKRKRESLEVGLSGMSLTG